MIDTRRWILVEAWLALGLRVEWISNYTWGAEVPRSDWFDDNETGATFHYAGDGVWRVLDRESTARITGSPRPTAPQFGTETLRHELAHYLTATVEQREKRNFGLSSTDYAREDWALAAERVIDAMLAASARVAELAIMGRGR